MEGTYLCGFTFFANFDSGNLARIEVDEDYKENEGCEKEPTIAESITKNVESTLDFSCERPAVEPPCDFAFKMWTRPDCAGTKFENGNRTWFYFGIKGGPIEHPNPETGAKGNLGTPKMLRISIMNLNKQSKLFSQGMIPIMMRVPLASATGNLSKASLKQQYPQTWERLRERPSYYTNPEDNNFVLTIRIKSDPKAITYIAFTYPYSYKELQSYLGRLEKRFCSLDMSYDELQSQNSNYVYFHRENLCYSLQNRRVDLITISGSNGILDERESNLSNLYPQCLSNVAGNNKVVEKNVKNSKNDMRPFKFHNKKAVFVSARVHPGETQSSFVMRGLIKFLLRPNDPRAIMLRKKYVFKLIPMLNPDGVYQGHYRTDSNGINLNRVYAKPDLNLHPSIYAARKLLLYVHHGTEIEETFESDTDELLTAEEEDAGEELSQEDSIVADELRNTSVKSNITLPSSNDPKLYENLIIETTYRESQRATPTSSRYTNPMLSQSNGQREQIRDDDKFLEPSESLRIRRDSTRSGEHIVTGSPSDSSPSSSSTATSRWLRSHRKSAMLEGMHPHSAGSAIGGDVSSNSGHLSGIMNWYEMTETSRCSEGDESIADFSICHPNSSSATTALAAAVGAAPNKLNILSSPGNKSSQHPCIGPTNDKMSNSCVINPSKNALCGSVGNSSSFQRATSFEGAFSALTKKGYNSSGNSNIQSSSFQPSSLNSNYVTSSPIRRLTFDDDLESDVDKLNEENKFDMDEKFDSDDGVFINKRTRAASSTSAFDQEEENANLDFATSAQLPNMLDSRNRPVLFTKGNIASAKIMQPNNVSKNTTNANKPNDGSNTPAIGSLNGNKESKEDKAKIYNSLNNKNKIKSNLLLYVDIHGHASKRGIFMYGNHFSDMETKIASMLLPKLMSINSANFDFPACNFTERNMFLKDRHTGAGREGSGRVSAYKATGLVQAYTLECNFNTGRVVNCVPMASRDSGRATPPPPGTSNPENPSIPKYSPEVYEEAGKAMAISILDLTEINPWTRLTCSACKNIKGVKEWLRKYIRHSEEQHNNKTPTKNSRGSGHFHIHSNSSLITSPARSLRSGTGASRRIRTFSANSLSGSNTGNSLNAGPTMNISPKWVGANSNKKMSRGSGPGSPGSYRPVSKIARKNSLTQQQCQSPANYRIDPSSFPSDCRNENISRPKLSRSKSLTGSYPSQTEPLVSRANKKASNIKDSSISKPLRKGPNKSNDPACNSKTEAARSRSRSKGRASKPSRQQRSPIDKQVPTMKWSHNGTLITHSLPPPQIRKNINSNKNRSLSANQKKRRITNLDKSVSSSSLSLSDVPIRGKNPSIKNASRKNSNVSLSNSTLANISASTSIDVEKQILSLTQDTQSSEPSVIGSAFTSPDIKRLSTASSVSSGIGMSSSFASTQKGAAPKQATPSKKRRIKRKKAI